MNRRAFRRGHRMHCAECDAKLATIKTRPDGSEQIDLDAGWQYMVNGKAAKPRKGHGGPLYVDGPRTLTRTLPISRSEAGVWTITPRARQRLQEGRRPTYRRPSPSGMGWNPEHFIPVPTSIECWRCGLVQTLDLPGSSQRTG
jgi:hypothetical protein